MMNEYRCRGCDGYIIVGQPVVLKTVVMSVQHQQLGASEIYHERCYPAHATDDDTTGDDDGGA